MNAMIPVLWIYLPGSSNSQVLPILSSEGKPHSPKVVFKRLLSHIVDLTLSKIIIQDETK